MEINTDEEMLKEYGWSELARQAFYNARTHIESAPATLKASWAAHYLLLWLSQYGPKHFREQPATISLIDLQRKKEGYKGRGAVERYETEVLWPMVRLHEVQVRAAEQRRTTRTGNVIPFAPACV